MAELNENAFISGVLRGVEIAVRGGLITRADVQNSIGEVFERSFAMVEEWLPGMSDAEASEARQVLMGELIGVTIAARVAEGDVEGLSGEELQRDFVSINGKIDHF